MNNNMNNTHHAHHRYYYTALFSLIIGIFVILIVVLLIMRTAYDMPMHLFYGPDSYVNSLMPEKNPSVLVRKGVLTLSLKNQKVSYQIGDIITVVVSADSDNKSISGYDAVLSYDSSKVTFSKVKNVRDDFQTFVKKGVVSPVTLTGVKKLDASEVSVFSGTPLAEVSFIVKTGALIDTSSIHPSAEFNLGFIPGSTQDSNLIDEISEDVLGKVAGVAITIGR